MLSPRFEDLLDELLLASGSYHRIPRTPDAVVQLAHARWYLESVRAEIAEERALLTRV